MEIEEELKEEGRWKGWVGLSARLLLGLVFVLAGVGKMFARGDPGKVLFNPFPAFMTSAFDAAIFTWLPRIELVVGLFLIIGILVKIMAILSAALASAFIINNTWLLSKGLGYEPCSCFGILDRWLQSEMSTWSSLILDVVMLVLVLAVLFWTRGSVATVFAWRARDRY